MCFCDRVLCALLETSCVTNFRYTQLQCRGMGSIWLMSELPCKNLLSRENSFKSHYYHDRTHRASTVSTAYKALIHCTSIPNIPSAKSRWLFFLQRPVRRLNPLLCQEWCQSLKTNQKMPVGKGDIITFCFSLKKKDVNRRKRRLNMIRKNSFKSLCLSVAFENIKMYSN